MTRHESIQSYFWYDLPVVSSTDDPSVIEAYAPDQLLVAFEHPETSTKVNVPQPDGVVAASTHHQCAVVLETGYPSPVPTQSLYKLACRRIPHLNA